MYIVKGDTTKVVGMRVAMFRQLWIVIMVYKVSEWLVKNIMGWQLDSRLSLLNKDVGRFPAKVKNQTSVKVETLWKKDDRIFVSVEWQMV